MNRQFLTTAGIFIAGVACSAVSFSFLDVGKMTDMNIWNHDYAVVRSYDTADFPKLDSYFHPGGTIIEAGIAVHAVAQVWYADVTKSVVILLGSFLVGMMAALTYVLRRNLPWSCAVICISCLSWIGINTTPSCFIASLLSANLFFLTVFLYERTLEGSVKRFLRGDHSDLAPAFVFWGAIAGALIATRIDTGAIVGGLLFMFLLRPLGVRKSSLLALETLVFVVVFDPYLWAHPVVHVHGLIDGIVSHQGGGPTPTYAVSITLISTYRQYMQGFLAISIATIALFSKKELIPSLPRSCRMLLLCITILLTLGVLASRMQESRYLEPAFYIWQLLFPLFILDLVHQLPEQSLLGRQSSSRKALIAALLILSLLIPYIIQGATG